MQYIGMTKPLRFLINANNATNLAVLRYALIREL